MVISGAMLAYAAKELVDSMMDSADLFESKTIDYDLADSIKNNVIGHAAAAAVASMAAGFIPGAAGFIALGISAGAVWAMYIKICKLCKIKIGKNLLKTIASAVISNIATGLAGLLALELLSSLVPGMEIVIGGVVNFCVVYMAGLLFLKLLGLFFSKIIKSPEEINEEEMHKAVKDLVKKENLRKVFKEAKDTFKTMRKDGSLNDVGKDIDIHPENSEDEYD